MRRRIKILFRTRLWFCSIFGSLVAAGVVSAQDARDLTGTFELNAEKSQNVEMVAATTETLVIWQSEDVLALEFTDVLQDKITTRQVSFDLLGEPVINYNYPTMGDEAYTISTWVDGVLVTTWSGEDTISEAEVERTETHKLSEDGQTLTVETMRDGLPSMTLVYDRIE